jgi:preprotein translocase subunit SecG
MGANTGGLFQGVSRPETPAQRNQNSGPYSCLSGAFGGGGSYALFGKRGATGFIAKATTAAAVTFMLTSFALAYSVQKNADSTSGIRPGGPIQVPSTPQTGAPLANDE